VVDPLIGVKSRIDDGIVNKKLSIG
jgi:hypothetical protein